jgi:hypothetical protein
MASTTKSARWRKYDAMLPLATEGGTLTGFVPSDWEVKAGDWGPCCQDPRNWVGHGEMRLLSGEGESADPWYWHGFRRYRDVRCGVCGKAVIATEYLWPGGE